MENKISPENKQVFIVDDDKSVCRAMSVLLATYGFTVNTYICADDFFRAVPNNISGCLVLDIHMPTLDGWETLHYLQTLGSRRPVILISADKNGGLNERALKAGAVGYLQKPFNDQELVDLINVAFEKQR
jgi:two-component system response regulator FixJ